MAPLIFIFIFYFFGALSDSGMILCLPDCVEAG